MDARRRRFTPGGAGWAKRLVALPLAIALAFSLSMLTASPAQAWMGFIGYKIPGTTHRIGTFKFAGYAMQVGCIDATKDLPATDTAGVATTNAVAAYIIAKWGQSTDDLTAAAMNLATRSLLDSDYPFIQSEMSNFDPTTRASIENLAASMLGEANANHAGYTIPIQMTTSGPLTGTVSGIGIQSAGGGWIVGTPITVTLSGTAGAVWDATGTATLTTTSESAAKAATWTAPGLGDVAATASTEAVLPGTDVMIHPAPAPGDQRMVSAGTLTDAVGFDPTQPIPGYVPSYSSQVVTTYLKAGDFFADSVTVSGGEPNGTLPIKVRVYHTTTKPVEGATVPSSATLFDTITATASFDANGTATLSVKSAKPAPATDGWYVAVESNDANGLHQAASGTWGRTSETSRVLPELTISTKISAPVYIKGDKGSDTAIVGGVEKFLAAVPGGKVVITGQIIGGVAPVNGTCVGLDYSKGVEVSKIGPLTVTKDGEYAGLGEFVAESLDCVSATETVTGYDSTGKELLTVVHKVGQVTQTGVVIDKPTIATQISSQKATVGDTITDTAQVTGVSRILAVLPDAKITMSGAIYGMVAPISGSCDTVDWTGAGTVSQIGPIDLTADGTFSGLGKAIVKTTGCASAGEQLVVTWQGKTLITVDHKVGQTTQTTLVRAGQDKDRGGDNIVNSGGTADVTGYTTSATLSGLALIVGLGAFAARRRLTT